MPRTRSPLSNLAPLVIAVWAVVGAAGCAAAVVVPPSRADFGAVAATDSTAGPSSRVSAGVHYASATRGHSVGWDAGAGAIHEEEAAPAGAPAAVATKGEARYRTGGYVEVARAIETHRWRRSWFGMRAEAMVPTALREPTRDDVIYALMARLSTELYATGSGSGAEGASNAFLVGGFYGTFAVGLYAEAGVRGQLGELPAFVASSGISVRLPFMAGAGFAAR